MLKLLGLFGGKWGLIAMIAATLTIAGLMGYIKLQRAEAAATEISLKSKNEMLKRDVAARDQVITDMTAAQQLYEQRIADITSAMGILQDKVSRNSANKVSDYKTLIRPRPTLGTPADTSDMEAAANGMNTIFHQMVAESQPETDKKDK